MATIQAGCPPEFKTLPGEKFEDAMKRQNQAMQALMEKSNALPDNEIVGGVIAFPVADGYANYLVTKETPLRLQHLPFADAYQASAILIRGLRATDVRAMLARNKAWAQRTRRVLAGSDQ